MKKFLAIFILSCLFISCGVGVKGSVALKPIPKEGSFNLYLVGGRDLDYTSSVKYSVYKNDSDVDVSSPLYEKQYNAVYGDMIAFNVSGVNAEYGNTAIIELLPSVAHEINAVYVDGDKYTPHDDKITFSLNYYATNKYFNKIVIYFGIKDADVLEEPTYDSALNEYLVQNSLQLRWIAAKAQNKYTFEGKTIKLANDIDMESYNFTGISTGNKGLEFSGIFDGNGFEIKNLKIEQDTLGIAVDNTGFIGKLSSSGVVQNLTVSGTISSFVGSGIIGINYGNINNVTNKAYIKSVLYAGGIAGYSYGGSVKDVVNYGTILGIGADAIVAYKENTTIENAVNNGVVIK